MSNSEQKIERKVLLVFFTVAMLVIAVFSFVYLSSYQTIEVRNTAELDSISQNLEQAHLGIENSKMSVIQFLTSGDEKFLTQRQNALDSSAKCFATLDILLADYPTELQTLNNAAENQKWIRNLGDEVIKLYRSGKARQANERFYSKERVLKSSLIEEQLHNLISNNNQRLSQNNSLVTMQERRFLITALILGILLLLILSIGYFFVRRVIRSEARYDEEIGKGNEIQRTITQNLPNTKIFIFDKDLENFFSHGILDQKDTAAADNFIHERCLIDLAAENKENVRNLCQDALEGKQGKIKISQNNAIFDLKILPLRDHRGTIYGGMILCQDVTEKRNAEVEQMRLRDIIEVSKDFIGIINLDTRSTIYINQAGQQMLGVDGSNDYRDFNVADIFPEWAAEKIKKEGLPTAVRNGLWVGETALILADKRKVPISQLIQAHKNDDGKVELFSTIIRDLSDEKEIIEKLKKSEERYRSLFNQTLGFICEHDLQGRIISVNPAAAKSLGYTQQEAIGRNIRDFLQETAYADFDAYLEAIQAADSFSGNLHLYTRNGKERFWKYSSFVCREDECKDNDEGDYVIVNALDITQNYEASQLLKKSEETLRHFIEHAPAAIAMGDKEIRYINVSPKWLEKVGRTREQMIGFRHDEIFPHFPKHWEEAYQKAISGETVFCDEEKVVNGHGVTMWVRWEVRPWYDSTEKIGGVVMFLEDFTERKKMEQELAATRDAALESARMKSEFLANMSHEIRTPMNGVIGMAELLQETNLDSEQKGYVETIYTSGSSLLTILNDILDFSKIESGKLNFETVDFNVRYVLDSVVELFAETAEKKKISLFTLVHSAVETDLRGDPGRLRQILVNLIGNAVKFTEKGEVFIRVEAVSEDEKSTTLEFTIADTGIGIGEEPKRRLFNAFEQADGTITRHYGGTGLGLAISKQLVEMMNGKMYVSSELGKGSAFSFTARFEKQIKSAMLPESEVDLSSLRVLIVDDNPTSRKILKTQTAAWQMQSFEADSPHDALDILHNGAEKNEAFDLAIIDLMMPGMDGFTLADRIKRDSEISSTKILMLPSYGLRGHSRQAKSIGVDGYLVKPVNRKELRSCIVNIFTKGGKTYSEDFDQKELITRHTINERRHSKNQDSLILVAEDNLVNQKVIESQLKKLGYVADLASNGVEVLDAIARKNYKLILMDCQMPDMDGFTTTQKIRESERGSAKHVPIVALTASAFNEDREKCLQAGMDDYISKPTNQQGLKEVLDRFFNTEEKSVVSPNESMTDEELEIELEAIASRLDSIRSDLDDRTTKDFIKIFIKDADQRLQRITEHIKNSDIENLKLEVHGLKGSTGNIGASQLSKYCQKIEAVLTQGNLERAEKMFMTLSTNVRLLEPYIDYNLYNNPNE